MSSILVVIAAVVFFVMVAKIAIGRESRRGGAASPLPQLGAHVGVIFADHHSNDA